jgi:hypothetical protein
VGVRVRDLLAWALHLQDPVDPRRARVHLDDGVAAVERDVHLVGVGARHDVRGVRSDGELTDELAR